jgi:hypothetical protein
VETVGGPLLVVFFQQLQEEMALQTQVVAEVAAQPHLILAAMAALA